MTQRPLCFIIMPYGSDTEMRQKHFLGVYESIIRPAVEGCGYAAKRSDLAGGVGNITAEIIRDLLEADIVVADLTEGNANVLFELGIRHVFRKSGTVHIVDGATAIPFDIQQYRAIKYSTDLAEIPTAMRAIAAAIEQRNQNSDISDNPVHDTFQDLPKFIRDVGDEAQHRRISELQASLEATQLARDQLQAKLRELDPSGVLGTEPISGQVDALLDEADKIMKSTGQYVLVDLARRAEEEGPDGFISELRSVLKSPYLSQSDFMSIGQMCEAFALNDHHRVVFELALTRFPNDEQIALALAESYRASPHPGLRERGRVMLEERLHISHLDSEAPQLNDGNVPVRLAPLFDYYFDGAKPDWALSIADSAMQYGINTVLIVRNRARALHELRQEEQALEAYEGLIRDHPNDARTLQWYADMLDDLGRYTEAYEWSERAILEEPSDAAYWFTHVIQILNRRLARLTSGDILAVNDEKAQQLALALLVECIRRERSVGVRRRAVSVLARKGRIKDAEAISREEAPPGQQDREVLDYLLERLGEGTR